MSNSPAQESFASKCEERINKSFSFMHNRRRPKRENCMANGTGKNTTITPRTGSVTVTSNGTVTVELGGFLKSPEGQKQLEQIRELRNFTRRDFENRKVAGKK